MKTDREILRRVAEVILEELGCNCACHDRNNDDNEPFPDPEQNLAPKSADRDGLEILN